MVRLAVCLFTASVGFGSIINPAAVDTSLFTVTTFASGIPLPTDVTVLPGGSVLISSSPGYLFGPGQVLPYSSSGVSTGPAIYTSATNGIMTGATQIGSYLALGSTGQPNSSSSITLVQPGATPSSPATTVATLTFNYANPWEHNSIGMAARPTPGVPGSYDLIVNVGAQGDNTATPPGSTVGLAGTGFSSPTSAVLSGDSLYLIRINTTGAQPTVTNVQQVATGIRNVYGMGFDPVTGDFYFADNAIDVLPAGSSQPVQPDGEPPQADELNMIAAASLGVGAPVNFGFPDCYIRYAYGGVTAVPVGSGCVQPILAFQPITDGSGTHELEGPTDIAFAPANFPAPFNNGVFIAFTGGESPNDEAGMAFYNFTTHQYLHFIESSNPSISNILGVTSTNNALFFSDFSTGNVYEIQSATPEPVPVLLTTLGLLAGGYLWKRSSPAKRK
jgi:glucose/arabinose dehydrogenase